MSTFIEARKALGFAVALTCRSIGTSPSAYYQRATGALSTRAREDERLLVAIRRVYRANYEAYGSLRVWKALRREGIDVGRGRVERLMAQDELVGAKRRGRAWKTTIADPAGCERPDLVNRDFTAIRPDALWIADFTYLRVRLVVARRPTQLLAAPTVVVRHPGRGPKLAGARAKVLQKVTVAGRSVVHRHAPQCVLSGRPEAEPAHGV